MQYVIAMLMALAAFPALAEDVKTLNAADLAVQTHRWEGKLIETTLNCFYADKIDYRCYDYNSFARVRVDFQYFDAVYSSLSFSVANCIDKFAVPARKIIPLAGTRIARKYASEVYAL